MKQIKSHLTNISIVVFLLFLIAACNDQDSIVSPDLNASTDLEALKILVDNDESLQSFEPNYNEEEAMSFAAGGLAKAIFSVRVGRRMHMIERNFVVEFNGDTAYGVMTRTFEGTLFIAASYDEFEWGDSNIVDTLIEKSFTTVVTRNIVFVKIDNQIDRLRNWRISAISLPEGGTGSDNIAITKMTVHLPDGSEFVVESPNDYYFYRVPGFIDQIPTIATGESVTISIELQSAYEETDFVTLTYGALRLGRYHRAKKLFELVSSEFDGQYYKKVYENTWTTNQVPGFKHAIISATPKHVIFDDATPVESNSWGMPYIVR